MLRSLHLEHAAIRRVFVAAQARQRFQVQRIRQAVGAQQGIVQRVWELLLPWRAV